MPIRFRCPGCDGLLSIATRKSGTEIQCPKCAEALIVPPPPEPAPEPPQRKSQPKTQSTRNGSNHAADSPANPSYSASQSTSVLEMDPFLGNEIEAAAVESPQVEKPTKSPPKPEPAVAPAPAPSPTPAKPSTLPASTPASRAADKLFEREDIEQLLAPATVPTQAKSAEAQPEMQVAPTVPTEEGFHVSRGAAVMLGFLFIVLLGLAFATGYLVGST